MTTKDSSFNDLIESFLKSPAHVIAPFPAELYASRHFLAGNYKLYKAEKLLVQHHKKEFLQWLEAWRNLQQ